MMLPPSVIQLLTAAFPGKAISDITPTVGSYSNVTVKLTIGNQPCVVKAAATSLKREDVRREAHMFSLLRESGLPIPTLLTLIEDEHWTIAITKYVAGKHGMDVLARTPSELARLYHALGELLAIVHATPRGSDDPTLLLSERTRQVQGILPILGLEHGLETVVTTSLSHAVWQWPPAHLVHGDAGLHNLLWDGHITALLDWEWSGWGSGLLDLAWLYWTIRWRGFPERCWDRLLEGYGSGPARSHGASSEVMQALAFGQIAHILVQVHEQSIAWQEWLRRLRWTISLPFPVVE